MSRNGFQQAAYSQLCGQTGMQLQQVQNQVTSINTTMGVLVAMRDRLVASLTTPDPSFGVADQADIDQINIWLAQWTTVPTTSMSFQQAVAAFLSNPPQV
jgi:hypothetical protein